ncbi:ImcF domain-containing protein [Caballeronia hypogeia]|uniref:ImcF domain-containing protein n=1 Tax=Caballeronia hypogeia TaxID=1777140 RepID=A0A158DSE3_9BURK|nr:ImcF domain-containing protein [Caballeronia hypogeia]
MKLLVDANAAPADKTTDGVDNSWGEHYETIEEGKAIALVRHEAHLAEQISYRARGNPFSIEVGEAVRLDMNPVDAPHGILITSIRFGGGRSTSYWCTFRGIPAGRRWRTSIDKIAQPKVEGILPARIDSPGKYKYSYLSEKGLYVTVMPFDLDEWSPGGRSRAIRMARPYAGANYGHHMPLLDGTEVALIFTAQDPNRPVIIGSLHDSRNPDLVNNLNHTRNIIRTAAQNEMRMEDNDASLPDMASFMRMDNGLIAQFVSTQLAGVIERQGNQWVAAQGMNQGTLTLDPAFLAALNKLARVSTSLFPSGDARLRFELRGVPTPGITDLKLISSGQQLHYFNQMEQWVPFEWPGQGLDNNAQLQWQTDEAGLRSTMYAQGRFALIRLFERAKVTQHDNARYVLSWTPEQSIGIPLSVQLRAEGGAGPLDVLSLRHFTLPARIFITSTAKDGPKNSGPNLPPLPPGAIASAQKVGVPLPETHR